MYADFLIEYLKLGHMSTVHKTIDTPNFYLPHHHVVKESSSTTKLRVVFDGSAKSSSGLCLNDVQHKGPNLQTDLFAVLINFRKHKFVITADINKMYRQIMINPRQRHYQQILWRDHPEDDLKTYQLNTVTYGTASAPYLAIRSLQQLAYDNEDAYPAECQIIKNEFYVDDLLTGSDDIISLKRICDNLDKILKSGGFPLHKWSSNDNKL